MRTFSKATDSTRPKASKGVHQVLHELLRVLRVVGLSPSVFASLSPPVLAVRIIILPAATAEAKIICTYCTAPHIAKGCSKHEHGIRSTHSRMGCTKNKDTSKGGQTFHLYVRGKRHTKTQKRCVVLKFSLTPRKTPLAIFSSALTFSLPLTLPLPSPSSSSSPPRRPEHITLCCQVIKKTQMTAREFPSRRIRSAISNEMKPEQPGKRQRKQHRKQGRNEVKRSRQ